MGLFSNNSEKLQEVKRQWEEAKQQHAELKESQRRDAASKANAQAEKALEKARSKAMSKGIPVEGAIAIDHFRAGLTDQFLVVFADRVELFRGPDANSWSREVVGAGSIPLAQVSSVEGSRAGFGNYDLKVRSAGNAVIEFSTDTTKGPYVRQLILDRVADGAPLHPGSPEPRDAATLAIPEQIRQLAELHEAGILNDEEFAAKKADLLERM